MLVPLLPKQIKRAVKVDAQMVEVDMNFEDLSVTPKQEGCRFKFEGFTRSIVLEK